MDFDLILMIGEGGNWRNNVRDNLVSCVRSFIHSLALTVVT